MVLLVGWLVVVVVVVVDSSSVESVSDVFVTVTVGCDLVAWSFEESMDFFVYGTVYSWNGFSSSF